MILFCFKLLDFNFDKLVFLFFFFYSLVFLCPQMYYCVHVLINFLYQITKIVFISKSLVVHNILLLAAGVYCVVNHRVNSWMVSHARDSGVG